MVRTIITPTDSKISIAIPESYVGKPIEITLLAIEELEQKNDNKTMGDFWSIISDDTAEKLHQQVKQSRNEW